MLKVLKKFWVTQKLKTSPLWNIVRFDNYTDTSYGCAAPSHQLHELNALTGITKYTTRYGAGNVSKEELLRVNQNRVLKWFKDFDYLPLQVQREVYRFLPEEWRKLVKLSV